VGRGSPDIQEEQEKGGEEDEWAEDHLIYRKSKRRAVKKTSGQRIT